MKNNVLVYVPDAFIESDIIATVNEVLDNASVRIADSLDAVATLLAEHKGWAWAVVDAAPEELERDDLRSAFVENEALPVVLSEQIKDPALSDWVFLDPPFSTEMLREALEKTRPY